MTVFNIIALIFREQDFFKRRAFLLTHPVALVAINTNMYTYICDVFLFIASS